MRRKTALSYLVPVCLSALGLAAGQACSSSESSSSGNTGGSAGDPGTGDGGTGTGDDGTGGTADAGTGGSMGGMPGDLECGDGHWEDPEDGTCQMCPGGMGGAGSDPVVVTCEDYLYDDTSTGWDPETKTLTYAQRPGLPNLVSATVSFEYCTWDNDCTDVTSEMTVEGNTLRASFGLSTEPLYYPWELVLSGTDACGNEVEITNFWFIDEGGEDAEGDYAYYCE